MTEYIKIIPRCQRENSVLNFSENHTNKIQNFMLDVMCPIIQEGESASQQLLDTILINIIEPQKVPTY